MNIKYWLPVSWLLLAGFASGETFYKDAPHYDQKENAVVMCCQLVPLPRPQRQELLQIIDLFKNKKIDEAMSINDKLIAKIETLLAKDERRAIASLPNESMKLMNLVVANDSQKPTYLVSRDWMRPYYLRAVAYFEKKRPEAAKKALEVALIFSPFDPETLNERGNYYSLKRNWDAAEADFSQALAMSKLIHDNEAYSNYLQGRALRGLGFIAVERKAWQLAEDYYTEALKINPNDNKAKGELRYVQVNRQ